MARRLLTIAGCEVVGEAGGVDAAVEVIKALRPDVVLLDVRLPGGSAADVVGRLAVERVRPRFLLTSSYAATDLPRALGQLPFVAKADLTVERVEAWLSEGVPRRA